MPPIEARGLGFIHQTTSGDIPGAVFHMARRCLVDTLAVWAAGSATETDRTVLMTT